MRERQPIEDRETIPKELWKSFRQRTMELVVDAVRPERMRPEIVRDTELGLD